MARDSESKCGVAYVFVVRFVLVLLVSVFRRWCCTFPFVGIFGGFLFSVVWLFLTRILTVKSSCRRRVLLSLLVCFPHVELRGTLCFGCWVHFLSLYLTLKAFTLDVVCSYCRLVLLFRSDVGLVC